MGCWNKTCGLTNLHITGDTEVYVFILEALDNTRKSKCYTTAFYKPLLLPFTSVYNEYGGGKLSSGLPFQLIMDSIKEKLQEVPLGDNQYHDIEVSKEKWGEELFFDAVHEDRLKLTTGSHIDFVMFRKDVVDHILDKWYTDEYVGDNKGTHGWDNAYIRYTFNDILNGIPDLISTIADKKKLNKSLVDLQAQYPEVSDDIIASFLNIHQMFNWDDDNYAARYMSYCSTYRYSRIVDISSTLITFINNNQLSEATELLTSYLKGIVLDVFMHNTRKVWIPGAHEGSQNAEHNGYRLLIDAIEMVLDCEQDEYDTDLD